MNIKRLSLIVFALVSLSCSLMSGISKVPTAPPAPSIAPSETVTPRSTATLLPTPSPTTLVTPAVYVPPSCQNTPLATLPAATMVASPTPDQNTNPTLTTDEQLKLFDELAAKINKVYLYPDFNGLNWPDVVARYRKEVKSGLDTETFYTKMEEFVFELGDDHSHFESPVMVAESEAELSGVNNYVGIGVLGLPLPDKGLVSILLVFPDSPAEHSGLMPHDNILAVDGIPIVEKGIVYMERVRGPECSAVVLTVQTPGRAPRDLTLVRYPITSSLPINARLVSTSDGSRIGYIFLPTFFDETIPGQVRDALDKFGTLDGLILDNRMNSGGSSDVLEPILSYFTSGTLGQFVSRTGSRPLEITADPVNNSQTVPLVILVGEGTISFGEIFSGALQATGRAKVVGQTTLGNVETLSGYDFFDGSQAWIAHERFDPAVTHADWEKDGIIPDVQAYADWDTFTFETDPSIAAALVLLGHK